MRKDMTQNSDEQPVSQAYKFAPGDLVDCVQWDATWPPRSPQRLGICVVVKLEPFRSQSGVMVHVKAANGAKQRLDQGWLQPVTKNPLDPP